MLHSFEELLAFHCAPALTGIKPSNLISCSREKYQDLPNVLQDYCSSLQPHQIRLELLSESQDYFLILVFREHQLDLQLRHYKVKMLLSQLGYPTEKGTEAVLRHLKQRLAASKEFPHEIGLFLGYPVEDVLGFVDHKGKHYKLSGYWKVYANEQQAIGLFERYTRCRNRFCDQFAKGTSIVQLLCTV